MWIQNILDELITYSTEDMEQTQDGGGGKEIAGLSMAVMDMTLSMHKENKHK